MESETTGGIRAVSVALVPDDRAAVARQVHANLMAASRDQGQFDEGVAFTGLDDPVLRDRMTGLVARFGEGPDAERVGLVEVRFVAA